MITQIVNLPGVNPASSTATSVKCPPVRRRRKCADCVAVIIVVTTTLAAFRGECTRNFRQIRKSIIRNFATDCVAVIIVVTTTLAAFRGERTRNLRHIRRSAAKFRVKQKKTFFHPESRIRIFYTPDPHQEFKYFRPKWFPSSWKYDLGFYTSRIPNPGVKKAPDPGSATLETFNNKNK